MGVGVGWAGLGSCVGGGGAAGQVISQPTRALIASGKGSRSPS